GLSRFAVDGCRLIQSGRFCTIAVERLTSHRVGSAPFVVSFYSFAVDFSGKSTSKLPSKQLILIIK
ncbi:MAG: hypothetical protein ABF290_08630, partial [Thiogranum sp.]